MHAAARAFRNTPLPQSAIFRGFYMIWERLSQKGTSFIAIFIALVFLVFAFFDIRYRYFHLCIAVLALIYAYRQFKKRDTPFERHERELRRKTM
jgi:predicted membrane protein